MKNKVSLEKFKDTLGSVHNSLMDIFPSGEPAVWGVTEGKSGQNETKWNRIEIGDTAVVLKDGGIFAIATVAFKRSGTKSGNVYGRLEGYGCIDDIHAQGRD